MCPVLKFPSKLVVPDCHFQYNKYNCLCVQNFCNNLLYYKQQLYHLYYKTLQAKSTNITISCNAICFFCNLL